MISILMPIFNGIEFIEQSVNSIIYQRYQRWELLIGVNGHIKNSDVYKVAKAFEQKYDNPMKIRVFDLHNIKCKSETLNELKKHCNYEFISLLDVDDIWNKDKLQIQSAFLNKYDVIGSNCIYFGDLPGIIPSIPLKDINNFNFTLTNPIINSSCIVRKNLCYWNKFFTEDYDLWLRLKAQHKTFYNCADILVMHRIHNNSFYNSKTRNLVK
jgi:glycosyltransferase involved in cell wall biosynthesis